MTLQFPKVPTQPYKHQRIFAALVDIARCDPGLTTSEYDLSFEVHYQQGAQWQNFASATRLSAIVNSAWPTEIIGLNANDIIPRPGSNRTILQQGGGLTAPSFAVGSPGADVFVDVTDANGTHLLLPDATHTKTIWEPLVLVLYHELGHVYHSYIAKDAPTHPDPDVETLLKEKQNRVDDNAFRLVLGLPLEHPTDFVDHSYGTPTLGGLTYQTCGTAKYGNPWTNCRMCSIATASLGSPVSREIATFRAAKRNFERLTLASTPILAPMLDAYAIFGPAVARELNGDGELRSASKVFGVQPALYLLKAVDGYLTCAADPTAALRRVDAALAGYESGLAGGTSPKQLAAAGRAASAVSHQLSSTGGVAVEDAASSRFFLRVEESVHASGADPAGPAWVLAGLASFLSAAADWSRGGADAAARLTQAIGQWLAHVPLPPVPHESRELAAELDLLRCELFPERAHRATFGRRLLEHWPADRATIRELLESMDFLVTGDLAVVDSCRTG